MNEEFKEFVNKLIDDIASYNLLCKNLQEAEEKRYYNEELYLKLEEEYNNSFLKEFTIIENLNKLYKKYSDNMELTKKTKLV